MMGQTLTTWPDMRCPGAGFKLHGFAPSNGPGRQLIVVAQYFRVTPWLLELLPPTPIHLATGSTVNQS